MPTKDHGEDGRAGRELARGKYQGFNDHHLTEKLSLSEEHKIKLSRVKVRRILRARGWCQPKSAAGSSTEAVGNKERRRG